MPQLWSLYNKNEQLRIDDLRAEQVKIVLLAVPTAKMDEWYACLEGNLHWLPIINVPEFQNEVTALNGLPIQVRVPSEPPERHFANAPENAFPSDPLILVDTSVTLERRSARRFARKLGFKITLVDRVFETYTSDVSMAGIALLDALPEWAPTTFQAELSSPKMSVRVVCNQVESNKLKLMDADSWDVVRQMLMES